MPTQDRTIVIATRGSALALAQANMIQAQCRTAFPKLVFELKIIKTTGDKLQTALQAQGEALPKGLFTKELEVALLKHKADLAVHSLKDLPTELPAGLRLGAVGKRADVRDVLIYRDAAYLRRAEKDTKAQEWSPGQSARRGFEAGLTVKDMPAGAVIATSSPRRRAQLLEQNPALKVVEIRGNVVTRLQKLAERAELDGTVLAMAGLLRLNFHVTAKGALEGDAMPDGLIASVLEPEVMLPCVGQAAIGIEIRAEDGRVAAICQALNHHDTLQCVTAERAFLAAMGGGCQAPVAAHGRITGSQLQMRVVSYQNGVVKRSHGKSPIAEAAELGRRLAEDCKAT